MKKAFLLAACAALLITCPAEASLLSKAKKVGYVAFKVITLPVNLAVGAVGGMVAGSAIWVYETAIGLDKISYDVTFPDRIIKLDENGVRTDYILDDAGNVVGTKEFKDEPTETAKHLPVETAKNDVNSI